MPSREDLNRRIAREINAQMQATGILVRPLLRKVALERGLRVSHDLHAILRSMRSGFTPVWERHPETGYQLLASILHELKVDPASPLIKEIEQSSGDLFVYPPTPRTVQDPVLVYCSTPSRLKRYTGQIMKLVSEEGNAPFHPFQAFPYAFFESHPKVGRSNAIEFCKRAIQVCDWFRLFGISEGTLDELNKALELRKPVGLDFRFDPNWRQYYEKLGPEKGNPLQRLTGAERGPYYGSIESWGIESRV